VTLLPTSIARAHALGLRYADDRPDVVGVGVGPQVVDGRCTGRPALIVAVDGSVRSSAVGDLGPVRREIGGVDVDIRAGTGRRPRPRSVDVARPGKPWFLPDEVNALYDGAKRRVLLSGIPVTCDVGNAMGAIGFFVTSPKTGKAYGVTSAHVVAPKAWATGNESLAPGAIVYHPNNPGGKWGPLRGDTTIGTVIGSSAQSGERDIPTGRTRAGGAGEFFDHVADAAFFELTPGTRWKPAVAELGGITGVATDVTFENVCLNGPYQVANRGVVGPPTGGWIQAVSFYYTEPSRFDAGPGLSPPSPAFHPSGGALVIRANPREVPAAGGNLFAEPGDSGSAVINARHELVGMVRGGFDLAAPGSPVTLFDVEPPDIVDTFADPVADVMESFRSFYWDLELDVALAEAEHVDQIATRAQP
jgi:hypothetical protein